MNLLNEFMESLSKNMDHSSVKLTKIIHIDPQDSKVILEF